MSLPRPHDHAAEQAVLGACLLDSAALTEVAGIVGVDDWDRPAHRTIFQVMQQLAARSRPVDLVSVAAALNGQLSRVGGPVYLATLIEAVPTAANAGYYAHIVADKARRRRALAAADRVVRLAADTPGDGLADLLADTGARLLALADPDSADAHRSALVCLDQVSPQRVGWIWAGRLPAGKVVFVDGDPGVGKSTLLLDLAARISTGGPMPDGAPCLRPGPVLILSAEDGLADTIYPRLAAAGAELSRIYALTDIIGADGQPRPVDLAVDLAEIRRRITALGVVLVIVDPLMAYLGGSVDAHRDQHVRRLLAPLGRVADDTGATVALVRHLTKAGGAHALYRGGGSIGLIAAGRMGYLVAKDPADDGRHILAPTKGNLAALPSALAYRLVPDQRHGCARLQWEGVVNHQADDLLAPAEDPQQRTERDEAAAWLREYLTEEGPAKAGDVQRAAGAAGLAWRTVGRARTKLGIITKRDGFGRGAVYRWTLPPTMPPPCVPPARHGSQSSEPGTHGTHGGTHGELPRAQEALPDPSDDDSQLPPERRCLNCEEILAVKTPARYRYCDRFLPERRCLSCGNSYYPAADADHHPPRKPEISSLGVWLGR